MQVPSPLVARGFARAERRCPRSLKRRARPTRPLLRPQPAARPQPRRTRRAPPTIVIARCPRPACSSGSRRCNPIPTQMLALELAAQSRVTETDSFDIKRGGKGGPVVIGNPNGAAVLPDGSSGGFGRRPPVPCACAAPRASRRHTLGSFGHLLRQPVAVAAHLEHEPPGHESALDLPRRSAADAAERRFGASGFDRFAAAGGPRGGPNGGRLVKSRYRQRLARDTVVLRDQGTSWATADKDTSGVRSPVPSSEEVMLLTEGNHVFLLLRKPDKTARPGEELPRSLSPCQRTRAAGDNVDGARNPPRRDRQSGRHRQGGEPRHEDAHRARHDHGVARHRRARSEGRPRAPPLRRGAPAPQRQSHRGARAK